MESPIVPQPVEEEMLGALTQILAGSYPIPSGPSAAEQMPPLPDDPTSIDDHELMTMWSRHSALLEYLEFEETSVAARHRELERVYEAKLARAVRDAAGKTVADRKAAAEEQPAVQQARRNMDRATNTLASVRWAIGSIERRVSLFSRELTRRTAKAEWAARSQRLTP
jgi:hypothetical protein